MKTKNLLLLGIGIAGGYLLVKRYNQKKAQVANDAAILTQASEAQVKLATTLCEGAWASKSSTIRFASQEAADTAKTTFMTTCVQDEANKAAANISIGTKTK
jgi:hypothetical protein